MTVLLKGLGGPLLLTRGYGGDRRTFLDAVFHPEAAVSTMGAVILVHGRHGPILGFRTGQGHFRRLK